MIVLCLGYPAYREFNSCYDRKSNAWHLGGHGPVLYAEEAWASSLPTFQDLWSGRMLATDLELFGMLKGRVLLLSSLNWGAISEQRSVCGLLLIVAMISG